MATRRRDELQEIEGVMRPIWDNEHIYEQSPGEEGEEKFMCTFPYPYMNGKLHLGHAFTVTKAEFASRYQRHKGKRSLFPFAFHCTGMPIQSAAGKLRREIENGLGVVQVETAPKVEEKKESTVGVFKSAKSKTVAKTGAPSLQSNILRKCGVAEEEIPLFVDPNHWLQYFPPRGQTDLHAFGVGVDWRRTFITTEANPYYNRFIQWQFEKLGERGLVFKGKRPCIFSPLDGQACTDHDRSSGEGVGPQEYTLIKLRLMEKRDRLAELGDREVYFVAATLRPETMYGQTNCFLLPEGEYGAYEMKNGEIFVCSERSMLNMAYQDKTAENGKIFKIMSFTGAELMGLPLSGPNCVYERIYTLPLMTIKMSKGTGVVTSVPSDAPADYAALRDLKEKPALREKFGITEEMVNFDVVEIIEIPEFGKQVAVKLCDDLKIKSQNDTAKLDQAKDLAYNKGFYTGRMLVGSQKGKLVKDAKDEVQKELISANLALKYWEPENTVISRSGDECVVTEAEQWFIRYGEENWCNRVKEHMKEFRCYNEGAKALFETTLDWLKEWACARSFGLGTKLPQDPKYVIESLSDSTIYMAYYTIAHYLQGDMEGNIPGKAGKPAEAFTDAVFDYVFMKGEYPTECGIPQEILAEMKKEFNFWYPMDVRVSGKDLIRNHLTMCLYNHAAVWEDDSTKWPRGFFTNGHVKVDSEKMSKSAGNFFTLDEAMKLWGADATRFACSLAGDALEDANFERDAANRGILKLTTEKAWFIEMLEDKTLRTEDLTFHDRLFDAKMNLLINEADAAYESMHFRDAVTAAFDKFLAARDSYREACKCIKTPMHITVVKKFMSALLVMMSPICPHWADFCWRNVLKKEGSVVHAKWPVVGEIDPTIMEAGEHLESLLKTFRTVLQKSSKDQVRKGKVVKKGINATNGIICVSNEREEYKKVAAKIMKENYDVETGKCSPDVMKKLKAGIPADMKRNMKNIMGFAKFTMDNLLPVRGACCLDLQLAFDESELLHDNLEYLEASLGIELVIFNAADESVEDKLNIRAKAFAEAPSFGVFEMTEDLRLMFEALKVSEPKVWTADLIRKTFWDFMVKKGHKIVPSSPVVPLNDPTLLFANAGMNQFKPIFLGQVEENSPLAGLKRATDTQKCIRAGGKHNDLDDVGRDNYHHSFFEMLGNWSFGDYFKKEAIDYAMELLVDVFGLSKDRLYATYFEGDEELRIPADLEAKEFWLNHLDDSHVIPGSKKDNFWEMGETGPCGPCTELHYDRIGGRNAASLVNMDDPNVLEIWNLVFIQFNRDKNGLKSLPAQHVDTGMGFERLVSVLQDKLSNYDTDVFEPLFVAIQKITGVAPYGGLMDDSPAGKVDMAYRVVADHIRTLSFAIADGAKPGNDGRDYVLRRILRRAVRYGVEFLNAKCGFFADMVQPLVDCMGHVFPELVEKKSEIQRVILDEEKKFHATLSRGLKVFNDELATLRKNNITVFPGDIAFKLEDTHGFPVDLTQRMAEESGLSVDMNGYKAGLEEQREKSAMARRAKMAGGNLTLIAEHTDKLEKDGVPATDDDVKYEWKNLSDVAVRAIFTSNGFVNETTDDETVGLVLDSTPCYAEAGGQAADLAIITGEGFKFEVINVQKFGRYILHIGALVEGSLTVGSTCSINVDFDRRLAVAGNHSMTHCLNFALRKCVSDKINQKGSQVTDEKLRFDFNADKALTIEELMSVEKVGQRIVDEKLKVYSELVPLEDAKSIDALIAVFGEVYPDPVRVVSVGVPIADLLSAPKNEEWKNYSIELCGGTHLSNTSDASAFVLTEDSAVASGVRRIVCLTGKYANEALEVGCALKKESDKCAELCATAEANICPETLQVFEESVNALGQSLESAIMSLAHKKLMQKEHKTMEKKYLKIRKTVGEQLSAVAGEEIMKMVESSVVDEAKFLIASVKGLNAKSAQKIIKNVRKIWANGCLMIVSEADKTLCMVNIPKALSKTLAANEWLNTVTALCGGRGGGKALQAQGQLASIEKLAEALESARAFAEEKLA
eukprot:TRINITY_DN779796_c0_g1_i1.p1 TRINITY_DN779796_c0_g1~~TRINITY_DN779796_c0_g1_i1.p1  ORF type:complete len:2023 (-),score=836.43 TRINITY_DN779796_c0_g1_i1:182-6250(-)